MVREERPLERVRKGAGFGNLLLRLKVAKGKPPEEVWEVSDTSKILLCLRSPSHRSTLAVIFPSVVSRWLPGVLDITLHFLP